MWSKAGLIVGREAYDRPEHLAQMTLIGVSEQQRMGRAQLGLAIGRRADEVYEGTIALLYRKDHASAVSDAYLDYRRGRSVVGTLLILRTLPTAAPAIGKRPVRIHSCYPR